MYRRYDTYAKIFQSTPSVGRATFKLLFLLCLFIFQSTPSVGRATDKHSINNATVNISIHALRGEGDQSLDKVQT